MQSKLRSIIVKRQNDIGEYERQRKVKLQMEQYNQQIDYSQATFFIDCEEQLRNIVSDSQNEQKLLRQKEKNKQLKRQARQQSQTQAQISEMLMLNIVIDFLRSKNINYTYSVLTREKNIISQDIPMKSKLASLLDLKDQFENDSKFNTSLLELILRKLSVYNQKVSRKKSTMKQSSIQCDIITNKNQNNNVLLTEIKLQQIRNQTQKRQKKHFQNQFHLFKSQELLKIKEDMNKLLLTKQQQLSQKYEMKIKSLIQENKNYQPNEQHSKKLQQYLDQINRLKQELRSFKQKNLNYQKEKLQHDCFKNQQIKTKIQQIQSERKQLASLKNQFELTLRNIGTKVEDLASQKMQVMNQNKKQTEQYLSKMKTYKENKDYMIEKVYSTLKNFELRVSNLSTDNEKLHQENQLLRNQISSLKAKSLEKSKEQHSKRHLSISGLKIPSKNVSIGVSPQQFQSLNELQKSKVQSQESFLTYTSEEFQDKMRQRIEHNQKINQLKLQMSLLKNKVKYLVIDFK